MKRLFIVLTLGATLTCGEARTAPQPVAELLTKTAAAEPTEVIRLIDRWTAEPHPLLLLARGQARWRLAQDGPEAQRPAGVVAAERDFAAAVGLDPQLRPAQLGVAQCAAAREDWPTACTAAGVAIDPGTADVGLIVFLANAGLRAGDWRLAEIATHYGIMRYPRDRTLRRIELTVLVNAGRVAAAREAVLALLAQEPGDVQLWRHLAWTAQESQRPEEAVAALEVALAVAPADQALRRQLALAQAARGVPRAALETLRPLLTTPAQVEADLVLVAARVAGEAGEPRQGLAWLAAIPEVGRTRDQRLLAARLAIQAGDNAGAAAALDGIIAGGERDAGVLAWAGSLADSRGDTARAEALYLQASTSDGAIANTAALRLVALYIRLDRREDAQATLAAYRAKAPEDAQARALQAQLERRRP